MSKENTMNIDVLLEQQRELKAKETKIKEELKAKKKMLSQEFTQSIDDKTREKIIENAEKILATAKENSQNLVTEFKARKQEIKSEVVKAKEMLSLVNHVINSTNGMGNGKVKNQITLENDIANVSRENLPSIEQNVSSANWQKEIKEKLVNAGYGEGVARNIVYKISCMLKSNS